MKIISYNVNGIRAAITKGFVEWLALENPDIIHLQEVKAEISQVDITVFQRMGYRVLWHAAHKKGYSGVATFTRLDPVNVVTGIGKEPYDSEGRFLLLEFGSFSLINSYFPSGTTGDVRQQVKEQYLDAVFEFVQRYRQQQPRVVLSGDYNICHKAIDINHPERQNGVSGFLPHERAWMDTLVESGFVDSFRLFSSEANQYSWWSYRAGSRAKNLGWRIDYNMVSSPLASCVRSAAILQSVVHSDHCPVVVEIDL
jgi:exodeoxyribonuclease-3